MSTNHITINIQIANPEDRSVREVPVDISPDEMGDNYNLILNTGTVAERALAQLHRTHYMALVKGTKISHKILKKMLTEALPHMTIRIINLGLKVLVLAGL